MRWLKSLGISPLGWMIIVAGLIYLLAAWPEILRDGPSTIFENPLDTIQKWFESKR